jgi:ornithine carbamoyltransferase
MTITEKKGELKGRQLVYVGDGNNMAHSLLLGSALAGMHARWVGPEGWEPNARILDTARATAQKTGAAIEITSELSGLEGADVVYTDVWASMGQEAEAERRRAAFASYQVDRDLMSRAKPDAIFLHCLPAHRGEEVAAEVIDGPQSVVIDQAENRLHAQKALMVFLHGAS